VAQTVPIQNSNVMNTALVHASNLSVDCNTNYYSCALSGGGLPPNSACWNGHSWVDCTSIG